MSPVNGITQTPYALLDAYTPLADSANAPGQDSLAKARAQLEAAQNKVQGKSSKAYTREIGQAALHRALEEMSDSVPPPITGAKVRQYQKDLEESFAIKVRLDVMKLGVSKETKFSITQSPEGTIQVTCTDPAAKGVIEDYLQENTKVGETFGYIQALANYDKARQNPMAQQWGELKDLKTQIQTTAIETFFGDALNSFASYSSLTAGFGQDGTANYFTGLNYTV
ncbi:hypothetical protein [Desulfovibrio cuneatus]|uniref:hypothetical protein n=1 Tax=Desulfovibrio cuneatus TaxID=159728 RepID=UPI000406D402|nr:hypothetical protein [Desulfovibrio cuneatus]